MYTIKSKITCGWVACQGWGGAVFFRNRRIEIEVKVICMYNDSIL